VVEKCVFISVKNPHKCGFSDGKYLKLKPTG